MAFKLTEEEVHYYKISTEQGTLRRDARATIRAIRKSREAWSRSELPCGCRYDYVKE